MPGTPELQMHISTGDDMSARSKKPNQARDQGEGEEDPYVPLAAPELNEQDLLEVLEARVTALEKRIERHEKYHFGERE